MEIGGGARLTHPVVEAVAAVGAVLDQVADAPVWSMSVDDEAEALRDIACTEARLAELELRVVGQAVRDGAGGSVGASSTASWWATETQQTRPTCHGLVKLAGRLDTNFYEPLRAALAAGDVLVDQARVIAAAVDALPVDLVAEDRRAAALDHLVGLAGEHDAIALKRLGEHVLEVVVPEIADQALGDKLDKEEERARQRTRLTMADDGHGLTHGRFSIPTEHADRLRKALQAIAAPRHQHAVGGATTDTEGGLKAMPLRLGKALCEFIDRYPTDRLAKAGGVSATVTVTIDLEALRAGVKPGLLDTGHLISASRLRMLACESGIVPIVMGGKSHVLDLGRSRRFFTRPQRIALGIEQGGCTARGCDWPPGMCHAHHDGDPWATGGRSDLADGRLLCPRHHARIHDPKYEATRHSDGSVSFHRRT